MDVVPMENVEQEIQNWKLAGDLEGNFEVIGARLQLFSMLLGALCQRFSKAMAKVGAMVLGKVCDGFA